MRALILVSLATACSPSAAVELHRTPYAVQKCLRCHSAKGPGIEFNSTTTPALAGLIAADVESGRMPPWVPSPESPAYAEDFSLSALERVQVLAWARAGAAFDIQHGDAADERVPDVTASLPKPYVPPPPPVGDEYRCFAVPAAGSVGSYRWRLGSPHATHHETALVITAAGMASARAREGTDGRPGFNCIALPTEIEAVANLGAAGTTPGAVISFPAGVGATVPAGGGLLVQMHYTGVSAAGDVSSLEMWRPSGPVHQLQLFALWAPVELPCPFETPVRFHAGQRVRISCKHDNGSRIQPSAVDGSPGYDGQAQLPLQDTSYKMMGFARSNEMCEVFLGITVNRE